MRTMISAYRRAEPRWIDGAVSEESDGLYLQALGLPAGWANSAVPMRHLPDAEARLREARQWFADRGLTMSVNVEDGYPEVEAAARTLGLERGPPRRGMVREPLPVPSVPSPGIPLRRAVAEDREAVATAQAAGFGMTIEFARLLQPESKFDSVTILLAVDGDAPAGTAEIFIHDGIAGIGGVCTIPSHRGLGLGRELMVESIRVAADAGCEKVCLFAAEGTDGFYRALGFRPAYSERTWSPPGTAPE
ncbi:MAG TPA: GNAT family N-acetyltransferase [Actinomycetota bacterium]|nr:GNAT family N-acetyltransferase [Actinomycetota bacterium]